MLADKIQNLFLIFLKTLKLIGAAIDFYGENGMFFFASILVLFLIHIYTLKHENRINFDTKSDKILGIKYSIEWGAGCVILVGFDCFIDTGTKDNFSFLFFLLYAFYMIRRLLIVLNLMKESN
jgi:hypothetical protein